ncbi:MAG: pyridoxamine 5'-phosphate oxidase family protein [Pirellulales bacterium]
MDAATSQLLGTLILGRSVAALATLHDGRPFASMIPFAVHIDSRTGRLRFITHVSRLSTHTRDMLESPDICLLVTMLEDDSQPPQALPRVSLPATAVFIAPSDDDHAALKAAYLARFPHAADYFQLGDFSIVALEPVSARFIAGFARALTLTPAQVAAAVGDANLG